MTLEVVGRHALLFDDDSAAAFINSVDALVEWHSLQIDRYDVRHLLSAPPPPRRRNRHSETILSDDPSIQAALDHERYLDLPLQSDQPEIQEDEKPSDNDGYRAVAFSYGNTDDLKNTAAGLESLGFLPPFPIPGHLLQSLPPTEKLHQIIARTAIFVSKNGGQSEIILRVKQGDNPTFGFLMPDHHLHAYFRFLVEHPELLNSESDGKSQDESKKAGGEHIDQKGVGGALSLLGSVYGTGEEEDGDDTANTEKNVPQENVSVVKNTMSQGSKNLKSKNGLAKDEPVPILSNKEKILGVKKNSSITKTKSGSVKGIKKDAAEGKASSLAMEHTSKIEPIILEPPPDLKRVINKLVEFIMRNGKQFEATLIEQDPEHGRFPFLLPSNHYHPYYLKVLQTAQESKVNGKSSCSIKDEESKFASLTSALCDMPTESDRKEKFKMVIGKSKKETQEAESKGTQQECGITVDAAAAAAILQAATRGIKSTNLRMISSTSQSANGPFYSSDKSDNTVEKSDQNGSRNADSSEALLTEEQKLKAERLKRAKMFVANLKSGAVPSKTGTLRGSSLEPLESVGRVNVNDKEREDSLAPIDVDRPATDEKPDRNYFGEEQTERLSKRKYRSRSDICEEEDEDRKEHDERHSRRKYRSKSRRHREDDDNDCSVEKEKKHHRRHRSAHSSSEEIEDEEESIEEDKDHKLSKKKHRSHHSSHEHSRKRRSSKKHSDDENDLDNEGKDHKRSRKKHRSHRSSHHSRDKYRHKHHSREDESRRHLKHYSSSDDEHQNHSSLDKHKKVLHDERDDLEEGEIISRVSEESRGIVSGHVSRETSVDVVSSRQRASSQPSETITEVPDDLRAKIRAMLMATRM